ncbi:MAG: hypothetical protein BWY63_01558 [Chloroflexi bacterium ADurb.Bin360]|nr:MAG: hypothetical protein BWY63_01558 [Chloroflexi bacterium ADurb.Bin360]
MPCFRFCYHNLRCHSSFECSLALLQPCGKGLLLARSPQYGSFQILQPRFERLQRQFAFRDCAQFAFYCSPARFTGTKELFERPQCRLALR